MIFSVEIKGIHDMIMLDTIIDMWKNKWKDDEAELKGEDDDDAEDEPCDCDDESSEEDDDVEAKAHEAALAKFAECLRDAGIADVSFTYCGTAKHVKGKNNGK